MAYLHSLPQELYCLGKFSLGKKKSYAQEESFLSFLLYNQSK